MMMINHVQSKLENVHGFQNQLIDISNISLYVVQFIPPFFLTFSHIARLGIWLVTRKLPQLFAGRFRARFCLSFA